MKIFILLTAMVISTTSWAESSKLKLKIEAHCHDPQSKYCHEKSLQIVALDQAGKVRPDFTPIPCSAHGFFEAQDLKSNLENCAWFFLSDERFLVTDCFDHDAVDRDCYVRLFKKTGESDPTFQTKLNSTHDQAMGKKSSQSKEKDLALSPKIIIKKIHSVKVLPQNLLEIDGNYQSKEIDGIDDQQRYACDEKTQDCAGYFGIVARAVLTINPRGEVVSKKIVK
jgi:hypothetical protein